MISIHNLYGFLSGKVAQKIAEELKPILDEWGLSLKQFGTLSVVYEYPNASQKEIGDVQKIDRTTCGQIIDQLQSKGYLIRLQCETNRKANVIQLTKSGKACIESLWADKEVCEQNVLACLSDSEKSELLRILKKVLGGMTNE